MPAHGRLQYVVVVKRVDLKNFCVNVTKKRLDSSSLQQRHTA